MKTLQYSNALDVWELRIDIELYSMDRTCCEMELQDDLTWNKVYFIANQWVDNN